MAPELTLEEAKRQITQLLEENRRLGDELGVAASERDALQQVAAKALQGQQRLESEAAATKEQGKELQRLAAELKKAARERETLDAQVKRLTQQTQKSNLQALAPEETVALLERAMQSLNSIAGLQVKDADITLKLSAARLGDQVLFVLPEPGAAVDAAALHTLRFNLRETEEA